MGALLAAAVGVSAVAAPAVPSPASQPAATVTLAEPSSSTATQPADLATTKPADPDPADEISLDRIRAVRMPGTRPLETALADDGPDADSVRLSEILARLPRLGLDVRSGFAVNGTDGDALDAAHAWIVREQTPSRLTRQRPISLVFFSYQQGMDIHVRQVRQRGSHVEVLYVKVDRGDDRFSPQIAIIPLNTLPPGTPNSPNSPGSLKIVLRGQLAPAEGA